MNTYGLLGYPLGHSFSRKFFTEKFAREGIDAEYINFELPSLDGYRELLRAHPNLRGHNVTIPYKQQIIPFLHQLSPEAAAIGAVNVVKVTAEGQLIGYNSDVIGFTQSIRPLLQPHHKRALILGTGGASKAIYYGLKEKLGMEEILFVSRRPAPSVLTYTALTPSLINDYPVIINCTPCGMYPQVDESPNLPYEAMTPRNLLYDLVYNPETTRFMQRGAAKGAVVKNGLEMLVLQAKASWAFWTEP
ncbi:MAG: shikimate dehydrogenase [Bacteroidaceae bacterium]|nr:shikimate dehydrogenase [Bacteroidaceae bacterium]